MTKISSPRIARCPGRLPAAALFAGGLVAATLAVPIASAFADEAGARQALSRVTLPPGFAIDLFAVVPGARHMAVSPDGGSVVVGTSGAAVWRIAVGPTGAAGVERFAPQSFSTRLNGPCFGPDGTLFVVSLNRIQRFDRRADGGLDTAHPRVLVPEGELVPSAEVGRAHSARVCRVGPGGGLYVAVGQPYNVPPAAKRVLYDTTGVGGILRFDRDGGNRRVHARGIRNSVGLDFDPADGSLWFTDNQVDGMGDDIPPGEINRAATPGLHFGFPWYGGGHVRTKEYAKDEPPADVVFPEVEQVAHAADLGMTFYRGAQFPARWRGIFSAQHGSWNRSVPIGARVMFTPVAGDRAGPSEPFAEGWNPGTGHYLGRPVDVAELADGSLLVSDDQNGAIYRITFQ